MGKASHHLVLVEWVDSKSGPAGWEHVDDIEPLKPVHCRSVGFLIDDGPDFKTLVMTTSEAQVLGRLTIPMSAITNLRRLK